jgi:peptidoglycan/xylan/chitin deacetylase (PgdA/CDA1 family)
MLNKLEVVKMKPGLFIIMSVLLFHGKAIPQKLLNKQVPILCYHNISKNEYKEDLLWISEARLDEQLKTLHDSGYHTILPEDLYQYMVNNGSLPSKPIMLSFDDSHEAHFSIVANVLKKYNYKAVFFVMTVCMGKKGYLTASQVKDLSDNGHTIGGHTYDHPMLTTLHGKQWEQQIDKPKQALEKITGKPVDFFAYPYGAWNNSDIPELKKRGINAAFQLLGKQSASDPLFSIRRIMVSGKLTGNKLLQDISEAFDEKIAMPAHARME